MVDSSTTWWPKTMCFFECSAATRRRRDRELQLPMQCGYEHPYRTFAASAACSALPWSPLISIYLPKSATVLRTSPCLPHIPTRNLTSLTMRYYSPRPVRSCRKTAEDASRAENKTGLLPKEAYTVLRSAYYPCHIDGVDRTNVLI